ncbi:hypothetical protein SLEP1_g7831 [Rubroshorea leprosula]|uniref:Uncharacterized protein n=1 Tax=Rubroshorea leprosula TaxID=152421 RepID=A0AAV5I5X3_9ROSI|nr:hypothetical protein SLEP1_g7831 [Rubroshorea leprosula]
MVSSRSAFILLVLLASAIPPPVESLTYSQYKTVLSLSHSLLTRVANQRKSRGDMAGSKRAMLLAGKLERGLGLGFWGMAWSVGWDYVRNYAWRDLDYGQIYGVVSDLKELRGFLSQLTRANSDMERAAWVAQNYGNALGVSKRMFRRLLTVFQKSGPLREIVETIQREVMEGGLLRDCLELGTNDLKGLLQILKDLSEQFRSNSNYRGDL